MLRCRIIEKFDEFMRLRTPWNELVAHSSVDHAYMKHEWFTEWIKSFDTEGQLSIVTIWADGQLVAAAPLHRRNFSFRGIKASGLSFLSSDVSPRCNFITVASEYLSSLISEVLSSASWDVLFTANLESSALETKSFVQYLKQSRFSNRVQYDNGLRSPFAVLQGTWDGYWYSLTQKRQRYLKRMCLRRLEKASLFRFVRITSVRQFEKVKNQLFRISGKSWKADVGNELRPESNMGRLILQFTPIGLERNWVNVTLLEIDGIAAAFEYFLRSENRYSLIRCDFDRDFSYYSPGNSLRLLGIKDLLCRHRQFEYDLGGDAYSYKLEWAKDIRPHLTLTVGNSTTRGRIVMLAKNTIIPYARLCREHLTGDSHP